MKGDLAMFTEISYYLKLLPTERLEHFVARQRAARLFLIVLIMCLTAIIFIHRPAFASIVLMDEFDDNIVDPRYTPIGSAVLEEAGGEMIVTTNTSGGGVRFNLTDVGSSSMCHAFDFSTIDNTTPGTFLRWEWMLMKVTRTLYCLNPNGQMEIV
jgi:hypothetical protein